MIIKSAPPNEFEEVSTAQEWKCAALDDVLASAGNSAWRMSSISERPILSPFRGPMRNVAPARSAAASVPISALLRVGVDDLLMSHVLPRRVLVCVVGHADEARHLSSD